MNFDPYPYSRPSSRRYVFTSIGKGEIKKVVDFVSLKAKNFINLGFGDLQPDGSVDDKANSNNGDILKVFATIVNILKDFTSRHPEAVIFFAGSTADRTRLYGRILKTYYADFTEEFVVYAVTGTENDNYTIPFDPGDDFEFLAFLIKRIN
jgi:hypothetical protein